MSWLGTVGDTTELKKLYGGKAPSLEEVELVEVKLRQGKEGVSLRFDLAEFPDSPPESWARKKHNTVQLTVRFVGIVDLSLRGWGEYVVSDLHIGEENGVICCAIESHVTELKLRARSARLERISGYQNMERPVCPYEGGGVHWGSC
ncbi:Immunity protein 50 [Actinopolyspora xinjiangensis]|uniref:Immunity protein 50 n=1 Tax=Actinopolyspora xinjiangensis TaxID=405564 RepID=A0A1H0W0T6_9ACTN|nr:Imm50 family immunity protein [Actinopolyspora xinjiangensis]SDP84357.1 Immunity protein 50 [Actinopolyspora xinjiangensis]